MVVWGSWNRKTTTKEVSKPSKKQDVYRKGRTSRTYENKLKELTSFYNGLFKRSKKLKQSKKYPKKTKYFCDRFLILDNFLKYYPLKEVNVK